MDLTITPALIRAFALRCTTPDATAAALEDARKQFQIDTELRVMHWLAQAYVESFGFDKLEENCRYTSADRLCKVYPSHFSSTGAAEPYCGNAEKLANLVYAHTNGNHTSGDGWLYRGRGYFALTGRANYGLAGNQLKRPYLSQPDLVGQPKDAAMTAAWFFKWRGCLPLADADDISAVTAKINPALEGLADRKEAFAKIKALYSK